MAFMLDKYGSWLAAKALKNSKAEELLLTFAEVTFPIKQLRNLPVAARHLAGNLLHVKKSRGKATGF